MSKFVVVGALGSVGLEIVRCLTERAPEKVAQIRAVDLYKPIAGASPGELPGDARVVYSYGDYRQPHTLRQVLSGATAIIFAVGTGCGRSGGDPLDPLAVQATARLGMEADVRRFIMVSRRVSAPQGNEIHNTSLLLGGVLGGLLVSAPQGTVGHGKEKRWSGGGKKPSKKASEGENAIGLLLLSEQRLRDTLDSEQRKLEYSIVRLGRLTDGHVSPSNEPLGRRRRQPLRCVQNIAGDPALGEEIETTVEDAAAVCVAAMEARSCVQTTFDLYSEELIPVDAPDMAPASAALFRSLDRNWDVNHNRDLPQDDFLAAEEDTNYSSFHKPKRRTSEPSCGFLKLLTAFRTRIRPREKSHSVEL